MGKVYDGIDDRLRAFLLAQPVFFVATAPSGSGGHVNLSPKGLAGCFTVRDERRVAYLDYTGSGAETIAHLRDNGRIVLMFCAFEGPPKIVRLHGTGRATLPADADLSAFSHLSLTGVRSVIEVDVTRVSDSCGFQVPLMAYVGERDLLQQWSARKTEAQLDDYRATKNATSVDGLPALPVGAATTIPGDHGEGKRGRLGLGA